MLCVLLFGSVGYGHAAFVEAILDDLFFSASGEIRLLHSDRWDTPARPTAANWVVEHGVAAMKFVPDFDRYGPAAAFRRTTRMVAKLTQQRESGVRTAAVIFWDGECADCVTATELAVAAGHDVVVYDLDGERYPEPEAWVELRAASADTEPMEVVGSEPTEAESA